MWGQIVAGVGSAIGAASAGGGTEKQRPIDAVPEYLRPQYKQATQGMYQDLNNLDPRRYYSGNLTANINKRLDTSLDQMSDYGNEFGAKVKSNQYGAGLRGLKGLDSGLDFTNQLAQQGPNQFGYDQGTYNNIMGNLMPGMQDQYNSAVMDNNRNLNWSTLPGLQMQGVGANAMGSSKLGQAGALATGMNADRNYRTGVDLWTNAANQANQGAMQGGLSNLSSQNQFGTDIMQGYNNIANQGLPQLANANTTAKGNIGLKNAAGQFEQQHNQNRIDNNMKKYMYNQNAPYNDLAARMNMTNQGLPQGQAVPGQPGMTPWEGAYQGAMGSLGIYNAGQDAGIWGSGYAAPADPWNGNAPPDSIGSGPQLYGSTPNGMYA